MSAPDELTPEQLAQKAACDKVYWHSRRGMLEIDLALMPYAREVYPTMTAEEQAVYRRLLECEDTDLFDWILQKKVPEDAALATLISAIITYTQTPKVAR